MLDELRYIEREARTQGEADCLKEMRATRNMVAAARILRLRFRSEGRMAYAGQEIAPDPPYAPDTQAYREWLHGWWSVKYGYYCAACKGKGHTAAHCPDVRALLMREGE